MTTDLDAPAGLVAQPAPAPEKIDLAALASKADLGELFAELDAELVGLAPVKRRIQEISALLIVDRARAELGLSSTPPSLHMCFTGNSGVGKTTVARRMARILYRLGYIRRDHVVSVTRDDLVGQFIGHTAPKTKEALKRAMGGVLFIDEAYYLYKPENERDYGQESIEILLQVMEDNRDDLVVILAGYSAQMQVFFSSNPGMASRIAHHIDFPDYSTDELLQIAQLIVKTMNYRLDDEAEAVMLDYIERRKTRPHFANARSIRNALDRARLRQARRLCDGWTGVVDRQALETIQAEDIRASRIFTDDDNDQ